MKRSRHVLGLLLATLPLLSASGSEAGTGGGACRDVDSAVTDEAITLARSDFTLPDGTVIDRVKFDDASAVSLPTDQRRFGVESILALNVAVFFGGDEKGSELSGVEGAVYLALGADDTIIAPLGTFSEPFFDLAPPDDPGWAAWAEEVDASDTAVDADGCVNPE